MKILSETVPVTALREQDRQTMLRLMQTYYLGVKEEDFFRDLAEKQVVALLHESEHGKLVGFSTLRRFPLSVDGQTVWLAFSGDTIVTCEARKSGGIGVEIGKFFQRSLAELPGQPLYYLLMCKGWRTYRVLPFMFRHYAPHFQLPTAPSDLAIIDAFGAAKYPESYQRQRGLIIFNHETQRIKPNSTESLIAGRQELPEVNYFAQRNPGHEQGDELVCLARIAPDNFTRHFQRLMARAEILT